MQKGQIKPKNWIRPNMALEKSHFCLRVSAIRWEKEKEKKKKRRIRMKKEEEKRRIQVLNTCLDIFKETIVRMLVWKFGYFYGTLV